MFRYLLKILQFSGFVLWKTQYILIKIAFYETIYNKLTVSFY